MPSAKRWKGQCLNSKCRVWSVKARHQCMWNGKIKRLPFHTDCQPRHPTAVRRLAGYSAQGPAPCTSILPLGEPWLPPLGHWPRGCSRRPVTLPECRQLLPWPACPVFQNSFLLPIRSINCPQELAACPYQLQTLLLNSFLFGPLPP